MKRLFDRNSIGFQMMICRLTMVCVVISVTASGKWAVAQQEAAEEATLIDIADPASCEAILPVLLQIAKSEEVELAEAAIKAFPRTMQRVRRNRARQGVR